MTRIESMLSARLFLTPQVVGEQIYFVSNMSGHLSLYVMGHGGSVPEPLLPPVDFGSRGLKVAVDRSDARPEERHA